MDTKLSIVIACVLAHVAVVTASIGDHTLIYQKCLYRCNQKFCSKSTVQTFIDGQPLFMRWLRWTCEEECRHGCMWDTVKAFQKDRTPVPQFHGKWPFVRLLGVQEPASVVFSVLNAAAHVTMVTKFRRRVSAASPMYYIWHCYALVALSTWIASAIFHSRDLYYTELLDYFCAFAFVLFQLFVLCARLLVGAPWWSISAVGTGMLSFYVYHIHYLTYVNFDYGYNMQVNICVGALNAVGWIVWAYRVRRRRRYVWKAVVTVIAVGALMLLELGDFAPIWWTFDAHSLWHAGTAPLPLLWYSFMIDDSLQLRQEMTASTTGTKPKLESHNGLARNSGPEIAAKKKRNPDSNIITPLSVLAFVVSTQQ